jgi:hypothetical protein
MANLVPKHIANPLQLRYNQFMLLMSATFMKGNIMRFNPETKTFKVFNALYQGETLTPATAAKRFGVKNLSAEVSRVRQAGFCVYANTRKAGNGVTVTEYAIGTPSRKLIAAGYKAMALGIA